MIYASAIILGAGTASDTTSDIMERGGSEEEALIGGAVSGIMEGIFERFSLSELEAMMLLPVNTVKDVVGNITKSVVTNAGEEFSTELANTVFDTIFMDELSTYALTVQGYMSQGRSEADARQLAGEDILKRLGESAMSGALMGVLFGGGASASGYHRAHLAARGDAKLLSGEMPTPRELEAMNLSDAEARGAMVMLNLDQYDGTTDSHVENSADLVLENDPDTEKPYATSRPSYAKGQVEAVWENAKDSVTGKVYDPSGAEIVWDRSKPRKGQWDMGHLPDHKYSEVHKRYMAGKMSKEDFLAWYRDPTHYRPELPRTNRSHKYE